MSEPAGRLVHSIRMTTVQRDRLLALQAQTGLTVAEMIRRALDDYLDRHDAVLHPGAGIVPLRTKQVRRK